MSVKIFLLSASLTLVALNAQARGLDRMAPARGFLEQKKLCNQSGECELYNLIVAYNQNVAKCNDRGILGGQDEESVDACADAKKVLAEAEGKIKLDK